MNESTGRHPSPGPAGEGRLVSSMRQRDGRGLIHVEDIVETDVEDLWDALVRPDRLRRWLVDVEGDLAVGGEVRLAFTSGWQGTGHVEVCERPRLLRVRIDGEDGAPGTEMEAVLEPVEGGVRLVIEDRGLPVDELPMHGAGWQVHWEDLGAHLAGRRPEAWRPRWLALVPAYQGRPVTPA